VFQLKVETGKKVNLSQRLIFHIAMNACEGVTTQFHGFLTSPINKAKWPSPRSGRFISGKDAPCPTVGLEALVKRKISSPLRKLIVLDSIPFELSRNSNQVLYEQQPDSLDIFQLVRTD
jgi:hypothetical protein